MDPLTRHLLGQLLILAGGFLGCIVLGVLIAVTPWLVRRTFHGGCGLLLAPWRLVAWCVAGAAARRRTALTDLVDLTRMGPDEAARVRQFRNR